MRDGQKVGLASVLQDASLEILRRSQSILRHERDEGIKIISRDLSDSKIMTTHGQSHGPFELWGAFAS